MKHRESNLQIQCVRWFRLQYPKYAKLLFAVPNGGYRNKIEAGIMKAEGVVSGVADLILLIPSKGFNSLCIEMKTDKGRQNENQKAWQSDTENVGNAYKICRSVDDFMNEINGYLNA